jgi:pimeloyl-ACP methyl ester carboxylesterase
MGTARSSRLVRLVVPSLVLLTGAAAFPDSVLASSEPGTEFGGIWMGALQLPVERPPRIVLRVTRDADGRLKAYVENPDARDQHHADSVVLDKGHLRVAVDSMGGVLEGEIQAEGERIDATWSQAGRSFAVVLQRLGERPGPRRPQEPKRPFPYDEEEILFENRPAGVKLAGTLTLPRNARRAPAVLLCAGSGSEDRDLAFFPVLADDLTRRGIATLRYDKRGIWKSGGNFHEATTADFASDARAGLAYLRSRPEIDPARVGLIGHSEGAMVGELLAAEEPEVAFVVLLAGPGVPLHELLVTQRCLEAKLDGAGEDKIAFLRDWYRSLYTVALEVRDDATAREAIRKAYAGLSEGQREMLGWTPEWLDRKIGDVLSPWSRQLLAFDPGPLLVKVKCPVLALNGTKDMQVSTAENLKGIQEGLAAAGNRRFTVRELPGLNHVFQTAETGAEREYATIEELIAPIALEAIGSWLRDTTGGSASPPGE